MDTEDSLAPAGMGCALQGLASWLFLLVGRRKLGYTFREDPKGSGVIKHPAKHLTLLSYSTLPKALCKVGLIVTALQGK